MIVRWLAVLFLFQVLEGWAASYPVDIVKGFIITEAVIDGEAVNVILDSGAPGFVLNEKYYTPDAGKDLSCSGINGQFNCGTHLIRSWQWLGAEDRKTRALVSDLSFLEAATQQDIYAVIGLNVLNDYYVSIDIDRHLISLEKENPETGEAPYYKFNYVDHLPVISCTVNGKKKILGIDTGSASNYLFNFDADQVDLTQTSTSPVIVIGTGNQEVLKQKIVLDLKTPAESLPIASSFIVDIGQQGQFSHEAFDGLLGQEFLSQYNLIIHPGKQKMMLIPRHQEDVVLQ
jgi:hypothetical protein